ncbi:MAG: DUF3662 and FHA domain-containing protein [Chloroflexales bacterium]|nr:DUF3662 and FHA domain-containing protein [Chloroflexales bacterium]
MSLFARFESFMEQIVETSMARFFQSPLETAVLTRRLERAMEANQITNGTSAVVVPDLYRLFLHPNDFETYRKRHLRIEQELATYLTELARNRGFITPNPIIVLLASDPTVQRSVVRVESGKSNQGTERDFTSSRADEAAENQIDYRHPTILNTQPERYPTRQQHVLIVSADNVIEHIPVTQTLITIGRAPGNNIILQDHQVSRQHAKISYNAQRFAITDLTSRNGTFINGTQLSTAPHIINIETDVITISNYTLTIQTVTHE